MKCDIARLFHYYSYQLNRSDSNVYFSFLLQVRMYNVWLFNVIQSTSKLISYVNRYVNWVAYLLPYIGSLYIFLITAYRNLKLPSFHDSSQFTKLCGVRSVHTRTISDNKDTGVKLEESLSNFLDVSLTSKRIYVSLTLDSFISLTFLQNAPRNASPGVGSKKGSRQVYRFFEHKFV